MRRVILDLIVVSVLVGGHIALRAAEQRSVDLSRFTGEYWFIIWAVAMSLAASFRRIVGALMTKEKSILYGLIEWFAVAVITNVLVVALDVRWHPEYNLKTVLALGLFTTIVPALLASSAFYVLVSALLLKIRQSESVGN